MHHININMYDLFFLTYDVQRNRRAGKNQFLQNS